MKTLDELLHQSRAHHGHSCPGQILGIRMAMLGCSLIGVPEPLDSKSLIVYVEIDRCVTDAIQSATGCKLGKRTLKFLDYGKVAATFVNIQTGEAVRIVAREDSREAAWRYAPPGLDKKAAQAHAYRVMPDSELFIATPVEVSIPEADMPGPPLRRVTCYACGEGVSDGREVEREGVALCRACADGAYYGVLVPKLLVLETP